MMMGDLFQETSLALTANKARSGLTMLGIIIGIASVIAMVALGQGAQQSVEDRIQSIGSNLITVMPGSATASGGVSGGFGSASTLTYDDALAIKESTLVEATAPEVSSRYQVVVQGANTNTSITGTTPDYLTVRNVTISEGSFLTEQHLNQLSKVAVLGPDTVTDLFGENASPVGSTIRINNINFTVIGTTEAKGGTGFGSSDDIIYVPITTSQRFFSGDNTVSSIGVAATSEETMTQTQDEIINILLGRHNISNPELADFRIFNQADLVETASSVTETFTILLAAVAGISLIVGGIGIMNMMLTTVTERTREIGLRKAIGAKRTDINSQFLLEAVLLTFIGGVVGIILGWLFSAGATRFAGIASTVSFSSIVLAFGVATGIGIVFGYYPARRAARLNPIEALRYE